MSQVMRVKMTASIQRLSNLYEKQFPKRITSPVLPPPSSLAYMEAIAVQFYIAIGLANYAIMGIFKPPCIGAF